MASDYTNSKGTLGRTFPENAIDSAFDRVEPLLTPQQLRARHLFGVPLVSRMRDPITNTVMVMTDEMLQDYIERSVSLAETEAHMVIFPTKFREKLPFKKEDFDALGFMEVKNRPVATIDKISVTPANNLDIYVLPLDWVEVANAQRGQINIVPVNIAMTGGGFTPVHTAGGSLFLSVLGMRGWVPAYWQVEYTAGFKDSLFPREVNELIGIIAAQEVLSELAATDADVTSRSLGMDGLSQSVGGPGADKFKPRLELLEAKKKMLIGKLRKQFGTKLFVGAI